jgi:hypothetical protein
MVEIDRKMNEIDIKMMEIGIKWWKLTEIDRKWYTNGIK